MKIPWHRLTTLLFGPLLSLKDQIIGWKYRSSSLTYFRFSGRFPRYLQEGNGLAFCCYHAQQYCHGVGLDVGAGEWVFPGARAVEDHQEENAYSLNVTDQSQDFIFSSHCLEHLEHWTEALEEWRRALKPKGRLYLYLPHPACQMWSPKILSYHKWQPEPNALADHLKNNGFSVIDHSLFPDSYLSFYVVAERT
jgi:SAM-dependent methyltransferase